MGLSAERKEYLDGLCRKFRQDLIRLLHAIQTGHPGGSLSATEILTTLYFEKLNIDAKRPQDPDRDRFILGKGHAAPMLYLVLAEKGFFRRKELATLRQLDSHLQGHPCARKTCGVELSTGPLGLGLPAGLGMAMAARLDGRACRTVVLMGDGEMQEGIVWEAAMSATKFAADNLLLIVDNNGVQLDGTLAEIMPMGDIAAKWRSFGWHVLHIDGHRVEMIDAAVDEAQTVKGKPTIIIADTIKGKGVPFMEGQSAWHGKPISQEEFEHAMQELEVKP